jgi:hypothetical protein
MDAPPSVDAATTSAPGKVAATPTSGDSPAAEAITETLQGTRNKSNNNTTPIVDSVELVDLPSDGHDNDDNVTEAVVEPPSLQVPTQIARNDKDKEEEEQQSEAPATSTIVEASVEKEETNPHLDKEIKNNRNETTGEAVLMPVDHSIKSPGPRDVSTTSEAEKKAEAEEETDGKTDGGEAPTPSSGESTTDPPVTTTVQVDDDSKNEQGVATTEKEGEIKGEDHQAKEAETRELKSSVSQLAIATTTTVDHQQTLNDVPNIPTVDDTSAEACSKSLEANEETAEAKRDNEMNPQESSSNHASPGKETKETFPAKEPTTITYINKKEAALNEGVTEKKGEDDTAQADAQPSDNTITYDKMEIDMLETTIPEEDVVMTESTSDVVTIVDETKEKTPEEDMIMTEAGIDMATKVDETTDADATQAPASPALSDAAPHDPKDSDPASDSYAAAADNSRIAGQSAADAEDITLAAPAVNAESAKASSEPSTASATYDPETKGKVDAEVRVVTSPTAPMQIDPTSNEDALASREQEYPCPVITSNEPMLGSTTPASTSSSITATNIDAQRQPQHEEEEDDVPCFPEVFHTGRKRRSKAKMKLQKARKKLKITLRSVTPPDRPVDDESKTMKSMDGDGDVVPPSKISSASQPDCSPSAVPAASDNESKLPSLSEFRAIANDFRYEDDDDAREQLEQELEDSLFFFQETHEEQDPAFIQFVQEREAKVLKQKLEELKAEDARGRREIDAAVSEQSKEKQLLTNRNIEKYQQKATMEETRDNQRLLQLYNDKMTSNNARIQEGIKILTDRHNKDLQRKVQEHRDRFRNQTQSPQAQQAWGLVHHQLTSKQSTQMAEFRYKGEEMKKKSENDFKTQQEKLRANYQKRLREIDASKRKVYAKIFNGFQQLRQRYLKRHAQKIARKKELILQEAREAQEKRRRHAPSHLQSTAPTTTEKQGADGSTSAHGTAKKKMEAEEALQPPAPIKSQLDWIKGIDETKLTGASNRHKQRKSVLSQISKNLSVEIHNEGLWVSIFADKHVSKDGDGTVATEDVSSRSNATRGSKSGDSDRKNENNKSSSGEAREIDTSSEKFVPWGVDAHTFLHTIICGEIPSSFTFADKNADFAEILSMQGGHVRCVVTDLRTSENTASAQRAASIREQEDASLHDLEKKIIELSSLANEAEATLTRAESEEQEAKAAVDKSLAELEKAKNIQLEFRQKFGKEMIFLTRDAGGFRFC